MTGPAPSLLARPARALRATRALARALGPRGLVRRSVYEAQLRSGLLARRTPVAASYDHYTPTVWAHRFDLAALRAGYAALAGAPALTARLETEVSAVLSGRQVLYGALEVDAGWPPRWHVDPTSDRPWPTAPWTAVPDDSPAIGDVKDVWELSRLPATFLFARAYAATGDERFVEAWWAMLDDWMTNDPPNVGVNWRCGQETSLRAIAVCFGLSAFGDATASTPARMGAAGRLLTASLARVRPTVGYALSQRNNHAVSELVLLLTLEGPQRRWCRQLSEVLADQWYADGSYAQQSPNYQRLAVQALQWLLTVRRDLPADLVVAVRDVLGRSAAFLERTSDPVTGTLANVGANDGAHLLPLSAAAHHDVRPLLASLGRPTDSVDAAEQALWIHTPVDVPDLSAVPTAWPTVRVGTVHAVLHVGPSRHRAGHADQLAVEARIDGAPVLIDPGTYRYSGTPPWRNPFAGPEVHSTLTAADESWQRFGRFLADPQTPAEVVHAATVESHPGVEVTTLLCRRVTPNRAVLWRGLVATASGLLVLDGAEHGDAVVRHVLPLDVTTTGATARPAADGGRFLPPAGSTEDDPTSGWWSPHYAQRRPCRHLTIALASGGVAALAIGDALAPADGAALLGAAAPRSLVARWACLVVTDLERPAEGVRQ